jgi:hypothetical protein
MLCLLYQKTSHFPWSLGSIVKSSQFSKKLLVEGHVHVGLECVVVVF